MQQLTWHCPRSSQPVTEQPSHAVPAVSLEANGLQTSKRLDNQKDLFTAQPGGLREHYAWRPVIPAVGITSCSSTTRARVFPIGCREGVPRPGSIPTSGIHLARGW